jgi:putative transposase
VADETVEGKSGKHSHGISKFYSSTAGEAINGVCFFGMSLVDVQSKTSYMMGVQQVTYSDLDRRRIALSKAKKIERAKMKKEGNQMNRGRKKGTKNKPKEENPSASYRVFKTLFSSVTSSLISICPKITIAYLVIDTAYGTSDYEALSQAANMPIISKLRSTAALYLPFSGESNSMAARPRGRKRVYGEKLAMDAIPESMLVKTENNNEHKTEIYHLNAHAKNTFGQKLLNVVIQRKTRLCDQKVATNIWFSTDPNLDFQTLLDYYSLRFQIEFDFRDAKQHFGLSDFKNYKQENLTNFVNLSFTMCLLAKVQLAYYRKLLYAPKLSIIDLKLIYKARFTAKNILKLVRKDHDTIFNEQFCEQFLPQDLINAA